MVDQFAGDFGVSTVMDDARTRIRTTVGTMNWMAPEVFEKPYPSQHGKFLGEGCIKNYPIRNTTKPNQENVLW